MKPLDQCRVLDLGIITAGAATSAVLADLGAEVIKIESQRYKDPFRRWEGQVLEGESPDLPPFFKMTNRGKTNLGIDLKTPEGRDIFLRLVACSDIVVENFSRGVLQRLGLDFETLKSANPDIILASISSQGENGPDAGYVSFGSTLEAMSGLSAITGYENGVPLVSGIDLNYPDQVVAIFASGMIATAWYAKQAGQGGVHLDLSQRELTSFLSGDAFVSGAALQGNAQVGMLVQDCFKTADDNWIAVSVPPENLAAITSVVGNGTYDAIAEWISLRSKDEVLTLLSKANIAVAPVLDGTGVMQRRNISWTRAMLDDANGEMVKGTLFGGDGPVPSLDKPAVSLGADTREILTRLGGLNDAEIDALIDAFVVSEPVEPEDPPVRAVG